MNTIQPFKQESIISKILSIHGGMHKNYVTFIFVAVLLFSCSKKDEHADSAFNGKNYSNQSVGKSAHDMLSAAKFTSLKIEIQYMPGYKPDVGAVNQLVEFLKGRLHKPDGISATETPVPSLGKATVSTEDVISLENRYRTLYAHNKEIALYVLMTDAGYTDNTVLGFAYRNTSICLFGKTIYDHSGGLGQANRAQLLATVLDHELGHLLGLVDIGSPMQVNHADNAHPDHCNNKNCLMYYAAETTDILGFLIAGNTPSLDSQCLNDLQANGGK